MRQLLPKASSHCDTTKGFPRLLVFSQQENRAGGLQESGRSVTCMHGERACVAAGIRIPEPRPVTRLPLFQPRGTRCQSGPSGPWQQRACAAHHVLTASPARGYHSPGHWWPASLQRPGHDCCTKGTLPFLDVAIIIRK